MFRRLLWLIAAIVTVGSIAHPASAAPQISAIAPMQNGYLIYGAGFGTDARRVTVIQNSSGLPPAAVLMVTDGRILVRSPTTGQLTIAVRVGDQVSAPVVYVVGHAPVISAVAPFAGGYTLFGAGFGTDRGKVTVIQNTAVLPPTAITALTDGRIDVRTAVAGPVAITVRVGAVLSQSVSYAPAAAPIIAGITPTAQGYILTGRGFGTDRTKVSVAENSTVLPPGAILAVAENRISVLSRFTGTANIMVRVGAVLSPPVIFRRTPRPPVIAAITPAPQGYAILGSGFGTDRSQISVLENNALLPSSAIIALADGRIDVRSPAAGARSVAVRVGAQSTPPTLFRPGGAPTVRLIVPNRDGYTIVGSGFGADRTRVTIIENGVVLPHAAIAAIEDRQIIVRSPGRAARQVAVRIDGATTPAMAVPAPLPQPAR